MQRVGGLWRLNATARGRADNLPAVLTTPRRAIKGALHTVSGGRREAQPGVCAQLAAARRDGHGVFTRRTGSNGRSKHCKPAQSRRSAAACNALGAQAMTARCRVASLRLRAARSVLAYANTHVRAPASAAASIQAQRTTTAAHEEHKTACEAA